MENPKSTWLSECIPSISLENITKMERENITKYPSQIKVLQGLWTLEKNLNTNSKRIIDIMECPLGHP